MEAYLLTYVCPPVDVCQWLGYTVLARIITLVTGALIEMTLKLGTISIYLVSGRLCQV
jgi:hypothetical protein